MFKTLLHTILDEWRRIFSDEGVILIMIAAPIIYATIYSCIYGTQVLHNIPIGVIDHSHTSLSRNLIQKMDAGANIYIAYEPSDMEQAKKLFYERKIYSIVYIPSSFDKNILRGEQATLSLYLDASYLLVYRQTFHELTSLIGSQNIAIEYSNLIAEEVTPQQAQTITTPVIYNSHNLFNPYLGYGTFLMPPVIILILQQTLLIGAGMIAGTKPRRIRLSSQHRSAIGSILGKVIAYSSIYAIIALYLVNIHFRLFHYPDNSTSANTTIFLGLYLLVCSMMATAIATLFSRRETSLMTLLWSSIPLLMLSGASYPLEAMPRALQWLSWIFPSTHGIRGFCLIHMTGASLCDVWQEIINLLTLGCVYLLLAYIGYSLKKHAFHNHLITT